MIVCGNKPAQQSPQQADGIMLAIAININKVLANN